MPTPIRVQVVRSEDDALTPETEAEVVVGRRDLVGDSVYPYDDLIATFRHEADGHYVNATAEPENEPGAGEWLLVVRKKGFGVVVQKLTFKDKSGVLRATGGWKGEPAEASGIAATVTIVNFDEARGSPTPKQSTIVIRLFPTQRFVGLGCRDHHGGTRFTLFAEGRRDQLFDLGKLGPGAIATILDGRTNEFTVSVKRRARSPSQWITVARDKRADKIEILDFYATMHDLGDNDPGTVVEAGIFGHAWHQGPIVQGTFDESSDLTLRDTADFDGRPKDWYPEGPVSKSFPKLKDAFAASSRLVIWGCAHLVNITAEAAEANRRVEARTPRGEFFTVNWSGGGILNTTLDHAKRSIAQYAQGSLRGRYPEEGSASGQCSYNGMMAQALKGVVACFAATPGMGANFGSVKGPRAKDGRQFSHTTMHVVEGGENSRLKKYFEREYGDAFERDDRGYMNYTKLLDAPLPDPGFATERFALYSWDELAARAHILRLPSRLEVVRPREQGDFVRPVPFSRDGETGHLYVARSAVVKSLQVRGPATLLVVIHSDTQDLGFFVTRTGKTLLFERPKGTADFVVPKTLPMKFVMKMLFDPVYDRFPEDAGTPLTSNLLEQVEPRCFW